MKLQGWVVLAMAWCAALAAAGCCCPQTHCGHMGTQEILAPASCEPPCNSCGEGCSSCNDGCDSCAPCDSCIHCGINGPCPKQSGGRGLFDYLFCGGGCGEIYVHPWINEPCEPCDPCDCHANWIGP